MIAKIIGFVKSYHSDIVLALCIVLITIISFNMGRASGPERSKTAVILSGPGVSTVPTSQSPISDTKATQTTNTNKDPRVFASKTSSSKVYHFSWCSGASRILDKNKLTFANESAAIATGYTLAGNCKK